MHVGIVGLGYVGLPLAVSFCEAGHHVVGVDVDPRKVEAIGAVESYIEDVPSEQLEAVKERLVADRALRGADRCEAVIIAVPTPLTRNSEPDLAPCSPRPGRSRAILQRGQLVVLESTTYPGTTRERLVPLLEESGLDGGERLQRRVLARARRPGAHGLHDPEHAEGRRRADGGVPRAGGALYGEVCDEVVCVSTPEVAELTKLLENIFRSVNIALVNELAMLCDRMGIDIWEVVDAASTKPYGFMRFEPGPGMGGHCLPVDPFYLAWRAREFGSPTEFVELAGEVNQEMPRFCAEKVARALNDDCQAGAGLAHRHPGRVLQGGRGRHARVARAEDHEDPAGAGRRFATTTSSCPSSPSSSSRRRSSTRRWRAATWR